MICLVNTVTVIAKNLMNFVYPLHCAICKAPLDPMDELGVCGRCIAGIRRNPMPHCASCGRSVSDASALCAECRGKRFHFERSYSACLYEGDLKKLIHLFKYRGKLALAGLLSKLMIDFIDENRELISGIDAITYVPLQPRRLKNREFNQSRVLAVNIARQFGIQIFDLLEKKRSTRPQNTLSRHERLTNLKNVFAAKHGVNPVNKGILLIDDVMTTGATNDECSRTLLASGVKFVRGLTLARGV